MTLVPLNKFNFASKTSKVVFINPQSVTTVESSPELRINGVLYEKDSFSVVSRNTGEEETIFYVAEPLMVVVSKLNTTLVNTISSPTSWPPDTFGPPIKIGDLPVGPYTIS